MVAKLFTTPFAENGDLEPVPNERQLDGAVSYDAGYGADYDRQLGVDPQAKNLKRENFNSVLLDVTTALQEMQAGFGTSPFNLELAEALPGGGYPKGAIIPRAAANGFWFCTLANNVANPDTGGVGWLQFNPQGSLFAEDTGAANAYVCAFTPALTVRSETQPLTIKIKNTNTGESTLNDGVGVVPLVGLAQSALQGNELFADGIAIVQWVAAIESYVVIAATGGATQVKAATKSSHAVNAGQLQSQAVTSFQTTGTSTAQVLTPVPAITAYTSQQRFNVTFNVASGVSPTINVSGQGAKLLKQYDANGLKVPAVFAAGQNGDIVYDGVDVVLLDTLPISAMPPGTIHFHAANTPPSGSLKANGALVNRTTYAALFAAIGTTFGVGDGSTTFGLPDLRAEFPRGWDDGRGVDVGRVFGSAQADEYKSHTHSTVLFIGKDSSSLPNGSNTPVNTAGSPVIANASGGTETRGRNVALLACIKY